VHAEKAVPTFVLHVDLDQFIAAVELLRRPELRGRPVVVGGVGDPTLRGVVMTASYEARAFGVHSGMPLRTALKRCPEAVFVPSDPEAYRAASREVMHVLRSFPVVFEGAGWDEAFLGAGTADPEGLSRAIQRAVLDRTRLFCSVGIGRNKLQAKIASDMAKPGGVFRLSDENWDEVMGGLTTDSLWGIGSKRRGQLAELGIRTVSELAASDESMLAERFGPSTGPWLQSLARGEMDWPVTDLPYVSRSRSREVTFQRDLREPAEVRREVARVALELARDVVEEDRPVVRVVVKIRFVPFVTRTHGVPLEAPSLDPDALVAAAGRALDRFELTRPVRLVGVRAEYERG
jgi:DNA polymerase IV